MNSATRSSTAMLLRRLLLLGFAPLARVVFADVEFTSPAGGASVAGGKAIQVEWKDTKDPPLISDLQSFTLFLCTGGNDDPVRSSGAMATYSSRRVARLTLLCLDPTGYRSRCLSVQHGQQGFRYDPKNPRSE